MGEGYVISIPDRICAVLLPFSAVPTVFYRRQGQLETRGGARVIQSALEARLKEALDDMQATQGAAPANLRASSKDEAKCVSQILAGASVGTAGEEHPDTCPIDRAELFRYFTGTSSARAVFDYDAARGQKFRAALASFGPAVLEADALDGELAMDEVEDQLPRAGKASSPGHDGIGYDIYRCFAAQLVPLLHAPFQFCWLHWRAIALAGRQRHVAYGTERVQAHNGCHENNFLATTLLDQTRRYHHKLYQVWYDLRNAFGSLPQGLMWRVLRLLGVKSRFIDRCQDIYQAHLLWWLTPMKVRRTRCGRRQMTFKVFCDSADGIRRCHSVVVRFLAWIGLRANPAKGGRWLRSCSPPPPAGAQTSGDQVGGGGVNAVRAGSLEGVEGVQDIYIYLKVKYALRHFRPLQSQLHGFDCAVKRGLRHLLRLPQSATTEFFYSPTSGGDLGLQSLVKMHHALQVAHAWQMLHSKDPAIVAVAKAQVCQIARKRYRLLEDYWKGREDELIRLFFNSKRAASPHATALRRSGDIASLWTDVQRIIGVYHISSVDRVDIDTEAPLALRLPHHDPSPDSVEGSGGPGKTVRVHGGSGSKFVTNGAGLSDAERWLGIQARLNQVDTNSVLK
ncbi:unnamed protein product [Peronospora belbahrii]|uniref:Reverse transcriptase domain-containing protein n=1 Tax=Peronospora belbahrii TaxID=622444 RepID=A0ABN8D7T3_9STRA|nr:unnamed protein product [Peronospora belbahrii]